jgi:HK97 family phage prohead protease
MRDYLDRPFEIKEIAEDGTFSGYGSVFNELDSYKDIVVKGAFAESLAKKNPSLLWQHRSGEPVGVYTEVREDDHGLFVAGKLALKTARGAEAYELMKMGAISGLSIGYVTEEDSYDSKTGITTLTKLDLWEVSLVTFPANHSARVATVKTIEEVETLAAAEDLLRDSWGLSRAEACRIVAKVKAIGQRESDLKHELAALAQQRNVF